jgi:hypothetical protein
LYKKLYAEMTNKKDRRRDKRARRHQLSLSKESSSSAQLTESESVGNFYSDSEDGESGQLFVTKIAKVKGLVKPSSSTNILSVKVLPPLTKKGNI